MKMKELLIISGLLILDLFSIRAKTLDSDVVCIPSLTVLRNTVWRARVSETLMINCTVEAESHCWNNVVVSWCKIDDMRQCRPSIPSTHSRTEWRSISERKRLLLLIFWKISMQESGLYRCEIKSPITIVSHSINVTVTDSDVVCTPSLMVSGNTVWRARVSETLMINCTVEAESHCWNNMAVFWCRVNYMRECRPLYRTTEWRSIGESKRLLFLIFKKISVQDSGLYRCEMKSPITTASHSINVTVTETDTQLSGDGEKWFYLIYFSVFVFVVFLAVALIMSKGSYTLLKDKVIMTTVTYEEEIKSSVQD